MKKPYVVLMRKFYLWEIFLLDQCLDDFMSYQNFTDDLGESL